ncbi:hypothetical protein [Streptomyces rubiginosohelvolus]|uniref:hypothetical protein n=1 Tax=Streptomyces rubiginosohelvolus TaxID=67362 RepID=UPI0036939D70
MTTTPKGTHMPTDPNHRALLRAVEKLTTQVKRIADTLETHVVGEADGVQTTGDDTPVWPAMPYKMCSASAEGAFGGLLGPCILRYQHYGPLHQDADGSSWSERAAVPDMQHVTATMRENDLLRAASERVREIHAAASDWSWKVFGCAHGQQHETQCRACRTCHPCPTLAALDTSTTEG